ncbi:MAG: TonB-dependent receptor [Deltaproteobacteria bacterium]|nr:TonB-dependent receptor [Deltaproteobacteria bacterium]
MVYVLWNRLCFICLVFSRFIRPEKRVPLGVASSDRNREAGGVILALLMTLVMTIPEGAVAADEQGVMEKDMGEIVVTATRYEEQLSDIPAYVTVITEEDIRHSTAQNIPDLLRNEVGIKVNDINGSRRYYTVDIRGFGETAGCNTLVLVDGRRVNQDDLSGTDWTQIPLDRAARIEIIRGGSGSVLYGDNASGGVINIITKEGDRSHGKVEGDVGSYGTYESSADLSGREDGLSYAFSGSTLKSDGYRDNSDTRAKDAGVNLAYDFNDKMRIHLNSGFHKDNSSLPGALTQSDFASGLSRTDTTTPHDFADVEDYYLHGGPEIYFGDGSLFKVDASFRDRDSNAFASFTGGEYTGKTEIKTVALTPQVLLKNKWENLGNSLTLGFDYQDIDEDIANSSLFFGTSSTGKFAFEKKHYGYYLHDELAPTDHLSFSGGYRYDKADFEFQPSTPKKTSTDENSVTAGMNYTYGKKSYAYLSSSRSFRYPLFDEFFSFFTNTIDQNLKPQSTKNYELGLRHYLSDKAYVHINVYRLDTDDEIFFNPGTFANENLDGKTRRDGLEATFHAEPTKWLTVNGGYTYLVAAIEDGQFMGKKIPDVPKHKATLGTTLSLGGGFSIALNGIYVGKRPFISDFANAFDNQDDYVVLNAKLKYVWKFITAFFDINNLTNNDYSEYGALRTFPVEKAFYPSPKINVLLGISAEF